MTFRSTIPSPPHVLYTQYVQIGAYWKHSKIKRRGQVAAVVYQIIARIPVNNSGCEKRCQIIEVGKYCWKTCAKGSLLHDQRVSGNRQEF